MYVQRWTFTTKPGTRDDVFELAQRILSRHPYPHTTRVYRNIIGDLNQVVVEFENESLAEYEASHRSWRTSWSEDLANEWNSLELPGRNDFWEVAEQPVGQ